MMILYWSKERSLDDWRHLFVAADPRLQIKECVTPHGSVLSILEVVLSETRVDMR